SPRVRGFFENVRRPLLPGIVKQIYAGAKARMDRKEFAAATIDFDRVMALLDEMGAADDPGLADLRTLAAGFRDLSKAATPAPEPPKPAAVEPVAEKKVAPAAPAPDLKIYTTADA